MSCIRSLCFALGSLPLSGLLGCTNTTAIGAAEAHRLNPYRSVVITTAGEEATLPDDYDLVLVPFEGKRLMTSKQGGDVVRVVSDYDAHPARLEGWSDLSPIPGPVAATVAGEQLTLRGEDTRVVVPLSALREIHVKESTPGRAIGIALGVVGTLLAVTSTTYVILKVDANRN